MSSDDAGTKMDLAERLRLTRRRVDQLLDAGIFYARADGPSTLRRTPSGIGGGRIPSGSPMSLSALQVRSLEASSR
jgi:hypothetical protein